LEKPVPVRGQRLAGWEKIVVKSHFDTKPGHTIYNIQFCPQITMQDTEPAFGLTAADFHSISYQVSTFSMNLSNQMTFFDRLPGVSIRRFSMVAAIFSLLCGPSLGQSVVNSKYGQADKFRQMDEIWPTPNGYRNAAGEPGDSYWQQRADHVIDIRLDDQQQRLVGSQQITYHNNSPHTLRYLWLHLDGNIFKPDSDYNKLRTGVPSGRLSLDALRRMKLRQAFDGGFQITKVCDSAGNELDFTLVKTVMRIDLREPLLPGESFRFQTDWNYQVNNSRIAAMRTGCEYFEEDGNYIYEIAQWFPRMVAFTDAKGWQHRQYLGQGEFTLELGDYMVRITVPEDHVVAATGVLQNPEDVLTETQQQRLERARTAATPVFIVTPEEAKESESQKKSGTKTWVFHAQNVRDFAWASSRKFIWDAQGHEVDGNPVMAMSFYPNEGEPLWSKYSTHAIIHTLNVYSRYTFTYPYPTAISVNGPVGGMEYPMICFNGPRPQSDGTYSERTKYGLISVIIHEVGHNYFPMIVNSDEREWTWMDEGINTFLQYLAEQEWEENYPSRRGEPAAIVSYMRGNFQVPIMTNSESVLQLGNNAYAKPATALNVLRETVLGRELFDFAFKEYARRWKFKRPMPADFFRTMEDASGVDLDWFWQGWFYTTDHCDIAIDSVRWLVPSDGDPDKEAAEKRKSKQAQPKTLSEQRNAELPKRADEFPELKDFYNAYDPDEVTPESRQAYEKLLESLDDEEKELLKHSSNYYEVTLKNVGGLVMPVILKVVYQDGSEEILRLPAEIWVKNNQQTSTSFISSQQVASIELDPFRETADTDRDNNYFPPRLEPTRFQLYKQQSSPQGPDNPMRAAKRRESKQNDSESPADNSDSEPTGEGEKKPDSEQKKKNETPAEPATADGQ
jgi:hypothetical protein